MWAKYSPVKAASPVLPWNITLLSQRDVQIQIPINYVSAPGVAVTAACFAHNRFEEQATITCISNLLAAGFRRLVFDLYWDTGRRTWSLCPVQIPLRLPLSQASPSSTSPGGASSRGSTSVPSTRSESRTTPTGNTSPSLSSSSTSTQAVAPRQDGKDTTGMRQTIISASKSNFELSKTTVTVKQPITANGTVPSSPVQRPSAGKEILYSIGPYECSPSVDVPLLANLLHDFLKQTGTTLQANLKYLILNLHAAKDATNPSGPAPTPPDLQNAVSLENLFQSNLSSFWLTPTMLQNERSNLNSSWYMVSNLTQPNRAYYTVEIGHNDVYTTPNGWPSESYMEFILARPQRLLIGYGTVDAQMSEYLENDEYGRIFPPSLLSDVADVSISSTGEVQSGCIFKPHDHSLAGANSSWAVFSDYPSQALITTSDPAANATLPSIRNVTACGISSILNQTLTNTTADVNFEPYSQFVKSSVWSWFPGEPRSNTNRHFRCAALDPTSSGRWRVKYCGESYLAACRANGLPYNWTISNARVHYSDVVGTCPSGYAFEVPRTVLENRYLLEAARHAQRDVDRPIWINFNSLDIKDCWVAGVNATCPYSSTTPRDQVAIPTIAAVIVLVLAGLTLLVKCGANRRNSRRKRKGDDGWDYEGVPS